MNRTIRRLAAFAGGCLVATTAGAVAVPAASASSGGDGHGSGGTLFVAKSGHDSTTCGAASSPCLTIGQAVTNAAAGTRILVLRGTYAEMVTITKPLRLSGTDATIDATGKDNGILVGPGASGATVSHLRVVNAIGEGILATQVDSVGLFFNHVEHNDRGTSVANSYPECQAAGQIPGDCGEGLHLQATTNSAAVGNDVSENAGGILVSDDMASSHGNLVAYNRVLDNKPDCGITVPAHNPAGGVYDNTIAMNMVIGNGEGGVLIAAGVPGSAAHDNRVLNNYLESNGFAGVTLHAHAPGQNLDNNVIAGNQIRTNNVGGDDDANVFQTTGVLIFSGDPSVHINGTVIQHNLIRDNHFGIWLSPGLVSTGGIGPNTFVNVPVPVQS
ncbi:MAG: right-handed parallel beta-helix repeat-containing protein [Acidimicrobiia bacterium]